MGASAIEVTGLTKRFGATRALDDVSLSVRPGSIVALLGANGAGKSTLIKVLAGVHRADAGEVTVAGHRLGTPEATAAMAFLHQDLGLVESMTVAENIALAGRFPRRLGLIDWRTVRSAAAGALAVVGLDVAVTATIASLSRAERSLVAIARAMLADAEVLVLDEPTASLPAADSARLFAVLRRLRDDGRALIYVSHRLDEVFELCDEVVVMRDGKVVADAPLAALQRGEVVHHIVGRTPVVVTARPRTSVAGPVLSLEGVVCAGIGPVSLTVGAGEVVGLVGLTGAGHHQVGRALCGVLPMTGGRATLDGVDYRPRSVEEACSRGAAFVTSNRAEEAVALGLTVRENLLCNPALRGSRWWSPITPAAEREQARHLVATFGVRTAGTETTAATLSGGNQQKVVLGRWLSIPRRLVVLEEPTAGVDVGAKAEIYALLDEALQAGVGVLLLSTDFEEVAAVAHRALVFRRGDVVAELARSQIGVAALVDLASGGDPLTGAA